MKQVHQLPWIRAVGSCQYPDCPCPNTWSEAGNEEDARLFLLHNHGHDARHCFLGDVQFLTFYAPAVRRMRRTAAA